MNKNKGWKYYNHGAVATYAPHEEIGIAPSSPFITGHHTVLFKCFRQQG